MSLSTAPVRKTLGVRRRMTAGVSSFHSPLAKSPIATSTAVTAASASASSSSAPNSLTDSNSSIKPKPLTSTLTDSTKPNAITKRNDIATTISNSKSASRSAAARTASSEASISSPLPSTATFSRTSSLTKLAPSSSLPSVTVPSTAAKSKSTAATQSMDISDCDASDCKSEPKSQPNSAKRAKTVNLSTSNNINSTTSNKQAPKKITAPSTPIITVSDSDEEDTKPAVKKQKNGPSTSITATHSSTSSAAFTCTTCGKSYQTKASLTRHQLSHMDDDKSDFDNTPPATRTRNGSNATPTVVAAPSTSSTARNNTSTVITSKPKSKKRRDECDDEDEAASEDDDEDFEGSPPVTRPSPSSPKTRSPGRKGSLRKRETSVKYVDEQPQDEFTFVEPEWFAEERLQPFKCEIDPLVPILLDVHSHLMHTEVIGLFGGIWDPTKKVLRVVSAHPLQTLATGNDFFNAEPEAISLLQVSEEIRSMGRLCVGWYHSHPVFRNDPSVIDVANQMNYQKQFKEQHAHSHSHSHSLQHMPGSNQLSNVPFVAAIITPFGEGSFRPLPSSIKWFSTISRREKQRLGKHIRSYESITSPPASQEEKNAADKKPKQNTTNEQEKLDIPMELWTRVKRFVNETPDKSPSSYATPPLESLLPQIESLIDEYKHLSNRVNFNRSWNPDDDAAQAQFEADEESDESEAEEQANAETDAKSQLRARATSKANSSKSFQAHSIAELCDNSNKKLKSKTRSPSPSPSSSDEENASESDLLLPSQYIDTKLDQFLHSLSGHVHALRSEGREANLAPTTFHGDTNFTIQCTPPPMANNALKSSDAKDKIWSPFYMSLPRAHQKFVRQVLKMVQNWKEDDSEDMSEAEDEQMKEEEKKEQPKVQRNNQSRNKKRKSMNQHSDEEEEAYDASSKPGKAAEKGKAGVSNVKRSGAAVSTKNNSSASSKSKASSVVVELKLKGVSTPVRTSSSTKKPLLPSSSVMDLTLDSPKNETDDDQDFSQEY